MSLCLQLSIHSPTRNDGKLNESLTGGGGPVYVTHPIRTGSINQVYKGAENYFEHKKDKL